MTPFAVTKGGRYDVVVVGGGPSGACAAIGAGRAGAKVLLIEKQNCLGGMWTSGFVNPLFDHANKVGLIKEMRTHFQSVGKWGGLGNMCFDYEEMKLWLEKAATDAGVELLYYTNYVGVQKVQNRVTGVTVQNIGGFFSYDADVIIDASGDACVAYDAGAEIKFGSEKNGAVQSMTLMFLMSPIPENYRDGVMFHDVLKAAFDRQNEGRTPVFTRPYIIGIPGTDMATVQYTHMRNYDVLSASDLTKATVEGRRQAMEAVDALRTFDPDFKDLHLIQTAPMIGVRESRRIVGDYILTVDDAVNGSQFEDGLTTVTFGIDIHEDGDTTQTCYPVKPYQIPYRSLLPKGLEGLLVVGRTISGDHAAMASYRVTADCAEMGECAGYAAYEAASQHKSLRDVKIDEIRRHFSK